MSLYFHIFFKHNYKRAITGSSKEQQKIPRIFYPKNNVTVLKVDCLSHKAKQNVARPSPANLN